jgi:hypothetical protein
VSLEQLFLQLGIAGALVFVGWKVSTLLIEKWSVGEAARTKAIAEGFAAITGKVDAHHTADLQAHAELGESVANIRGLLTREDSPVKRKTPVRGVATGFYSRVGSQGDE